MTNITKEQFTQFVLTNGVDEEGTQAIYELSCGCMVAVEDEGNSLILCDGHDDDCLDNEGKTFTELVADVFVSTPEEDELPETLEDLVNEKDEETMTITMNSTVKEMKAFASDNNIDIKGLKLKADIFARITGTTTVEEELTLDDLVADDAPMVDDEEVIAQETTVDEEPADAAALAQELLDLIAKGTNFSTLMAKVKENATAIVNGVVKSEPKKTEEPVQSNTNEQGASEASAITKFSTARIIKETATSVTFEGDGKEYIFFKNEAGKTLIRAIGSNTNQYMSAKYLQHLVYDINTKASRSLFRKIKAVGVADAKSTHKGNGAASEASAKEKNNTAKNNSAEVISMLGTEIPKAWFTQYVQDEAMTKKHGKSKMNATTIIAEYEAHKA